MRLQDVYKLLDEEQDDVSGSEPDLSWYNWVHYLADNEATVAINPVWRDPETCVEGVEDGNPTFYYQTKV